MMCRVIDKRREKAKKTVVTATVKSQSFLTNEFKGTVTYKKKKKNTLPPRLFPHNTTNVTSNNDFRQPKNDQKKAKTKRYRTK